MNPLANLSLQTPNGTFVFTGAEVPEAIQFGGRQILSVRQLQGGLRRVFAMGADDAQLTWTGLFLYSSAVQRARFLDSVRRTGLACTLSWDALLYTVIISEFRAVYEKPFKIPYTITFEVIQDLTQLVQSVPEVTPMQSILADMTRVGTLSACIGDSTLNGLATSLQSAFSSLSAAEAPIANGLKALTTFVAGVANCADQVVNTVTTVAAAVGVPLSAFNSHVGQLIATAEGAVAAVSTVGGVTPGVPVSQMIGNTLSQMNAAVQLPELYELRSIGARMQANLPLVSTPTTPKTITVGGGSLYDIAAQQYGDATRWSDIANANYLSDPVLTGINTITIPA